MKKDTGPLRMSVLLLWMVLSSGWIVNAHGQTAPSLREVDDWFILLDYRKNETGERFPSRMLEHDMAILDSDFHPPLSSVRDRMILLAYVSAGEAESYRSYWDEIKDAPWIVGENPNWEGNHYVDVRRSKWHDVLLDRVLPRIVKKGFDGVFLDTLDTASHLESMDNGTYEGAEDAMVTLVRKMRNRFPELLLVSNNGFSILDRLAPHLDGMVSEDIHWRVDFKNEGYRKVPPPVRRKKVQLLTELRAKHDLPVFVIDYPPPKNTEAIRAAVEHSVELGFKPYIARKKLNRIYQQE